MNHLNPDCEVESPLERTRERLESIKYTVEAALLLLDDFKKIRSLRWQCTNCGEIVHFAEPAAAEALSSGCEKCGEKMFTPVI